MGPFYSLYRSKTTGRYVACVLDADDAESEGLEVQFEGQRVPSVICAALIRQYGGQFRLC